MAGALLGETFIALINNGMIIANVNAFWQPIMIGIILLGAVILDVTFKRVNTGAWSVAAPSRKKHLKAGDAPVRGSRPREKGGRTKQRLLGPVLHSKSTRQSQGGKG